MKIIVSGASAGGLHAVKKLVAQLPDYLNAALLLVLHLSDRSNAKTIAHIIQQNTRLICKVPVDGEIIKKGHLHISPQGHHMMVQNKKIVIH